MFSVLMSTKGHAFGCALENSGLGEGLSVFFLRGDVSIRNRRIQELKFMSFRLDFRTRILNDNNGILYVIFVVANSRKATRFCRTFVC